MAEAFIYDHVRTPRGKGKADGGLHEVTAVQLVTQLLQALKDRNDLPKDSLDEFIAGCVTAVGEQGATLPRIAPIMAGFADETAGLHVNRFCASGLEAVSIGAAKIMAGAADVVVAGGVECMSRTPMGADGGGPWGTDPSVTFHTPFLMQGIAADLLATLCGFTRAELDAYAVTSQQRAARAWTEGYFARSVIPVRDVLGMPLLDRDEHPRPDSTLESLGTMRAAFEDMGLQYGFDAVALQRYPQVGRIEHVHTAATSSGIVDGAGVVLVGSAAAGARLGLRPRAKIRSFVSMGSEPQLFLTAPVPTCKKALCNAGMNVADIDLWELNEAFAAVPLQVMRELNIVHEKMNVNGGAIAFGHPLGATGAMILGTLLDELERRELQTGIATLCAAGGLGIAMVIERV